MTKNWTLLCGGLVAFSAVGCELTDVTHPTQIEEEDVRNATGTDRLRWYAIFQLNVSQSSLVHDVGHATDELFANSSVPGWWSESLDRRELAVHDDPEAQMATPWRLLAAARWRAAVAIPYIRDYAPAEMRSAQIGEMFAVRGYAALQMAENICPGFPLNEAIDGRVVVGPPLTTAEAFEAVLMEFDSVLAYAGDSTRILNLGRVGRGRALLGLGRFADAAAAVADVPTSFVQNADQTSIPLFRDEGASVFLSAADREGGNGLDFVSAEDPRVELVYRGKGYDGESDIYLFAKYPESTAPVVLANGIEARLIEAEAALDAGDAAWLTILNDLRATEVTPAMPALDDPGDVDGRVDLLFRERAFWMYVTGRRLADLRRLIAHYGRDAEDVFPSGGYFLGGAYGTITSLPFMWTLEEPHNPAVTGCTSH